MLYLCAKGTNQSDYFGDFGVLGSKFSKFLSFLKQISFSSNFAPLFSVMRHNLCTFLAEIVHTLKKGASQSTNLVKFHLNSQKSKILHFDGLLLPKWYQVAARKVQKSYISWHWRVMQSLKKNWLLGFKYDMKDLVNFHPTTQNPDDFTLMGPRF